MTVRAPEDVVANYVLWPVPRLVPTHRCQVAMEDLTGSSLINWSRLAPTTIA